MFRFEFNLYPYRDIKCGMRRFAILPNDASGVIGGMCFYSVWWLNIYFSIKCDRSIFPRVNTPMPDNLENHSALLRLAVWCGTPGHHQYCLTFRSGGSVWLILPRWMSYQNSIILHKLRNHLSELVSSSLQLVANLRLPLVQKKSDSSKGS